jgi:hypothetical protein
VKAGNIRMSPSNAGRLHRCSALGGKHDLDFLFVQATLVYLNSKDNIKVTLTCHRAATLLLDAQAIDKWEKDTLASMQCKSLMGLLSYSPKIMSILLSLILGAANKNARGQRGAFATCKRWWNYAQAWEISIRGLPGGTVTGGLLETWRVLRAMREATGARTATGRIYADRIQIELTRLVNHLPYTILGLRFGAAFSNELEQNAMEEVD